MNIRLLSHMEKRELLHRMVAAVRGGAPLETFCAGEGIEIGPLFALIREMRTLGTRGINPFLPDPEPGKPFTMREKSDAVDAIEAYAANTGATRQLVCQLAGITEGVCDGWKAIRRTQAVEAGPHRVARVDIRTLTPRRKHRIIAAVCRAVELGENLDAAAVSQGITAGEFRALRPNLPDPQSGKATPQAPVGKPPKDKPQTVNYAVRVQNKIAGGMLDRIEADLAAGMSVRDAVAKEGITPRTYHRHKARAGLPQPERKPKREEWMTPDEKRNFVDGIVEKVNAGDTLISHLKEAGICDALFYKWLHKHGTAKLIPQYARPRRQKHDESRRETVDAIITEVNNGKRLVDALRDANVTEANFYFWEKRHATVKRLPRVKDKTEENRRRAETVDAVIAEVNKGKPLSRVLREMGVNGMTFYKWEKKYATTRRATSRQCLPKPFDPAERTRVVDAIIADMNAGARQPEALKKGGISLHTFYKWEAKYATVTRKKRYKQNANV